MSPPESKAEQTTTQGRCLIDGLALRSFADTEAQGPLFCDRHDMSELAAKGVVGALRGTFYVRTPVDEVAPSITHHVCTAILIRPTLEATLFRLNDGGALVVFPLGYGSVGAHYVPPSLYRPGSEGMIAFDEAPPAVQPAVREGLMAVIDKRIAITTLTFGHFLDGTESNKMLALGFEPDFWLEMETGDFSPYVEKPSAQVFFGWRGDRRPSR